MADLLVPTAAGVGNVQVPNKGWFIFGGEGKTITRSLKLKNPSNGPLLTTDIFPITSNISNFITFLLYITWFA